MGAALSSVDYSGQCLMLPHPCGAFGLASDGWPAAKHCTNQFLQYNSHCPGRTHLVDLYKAHTGTNSIGKMCEGLGELTAALKCQRMRQPY